MKSKDMDQDRSESNRPQFPATPRYLAARYARLGLARVPVCPVCGKVRLMGRRFRVLGKCGHCLAREALREIS